MIACTTPMAGAARGNLPTLRTQSKKAGRFEPDKFEDHYETALIDLINQKRAGKPMALIQV
jgi:non-homologous end joining protein Ku